MSLATIRHRAIPTAEELVAWARDMAREIRALAQETEHNRNLFPHIVERIRKAEHLVDAGYISADHLVAARERFSIDLIGPPREDMSWQTRTEGAFGAADFAIDWGQQRAQCPEGHMSANWGEYADKARGRYIRVGFSPGDCDVCPSKARCTKTEGRGRQLTLHPREEHEALAAARARLEDKAGRKLYAQRQGVESAIAQAAGALGLRRSTLTALEHGLPVAHLPPHASRASPRLPRNERLRQQCLNISGKPFDPRLIAKYQRRFPGRAPEFAMIYGVPWGAARSKID